MEDWQDESEKKDLCLLNAEDLTFFKEMRFLKKDMSFVYDAVKPFFDLKDQNYNEFLKNQKDIQKIESDLAEFKTAFLIKCFLDSCKEKQDEIGERTYPSHLIKTPFLDSFKRNLSKTKINKQKGSNHPDISFVYDKKTINFEVKLVTSEDSRMGKTFYLGNRKIDYDDNLPHIEQSYHNSDEHDEPLSKITGPIVKAGNQYRKWIDSGTVKSENTNIVSMFAPGLFPLFNGMPILNAAYSFLKKKNIISIDNKKGDMGWLSEYQHRTTVKKSNGALIHEHDIIDIIVKSNLDGVIVLFPSLGRCDIQIVNINNNHFITDFYIYLKSRSDISVSWFNHGLLVD